jgi:predicted lipoprotein with Yx(FWY)xxD motif
MLRIMKNGRQRRLWPLVVVSVVVSAISCSKNSNNPAPPSTPKPGVQLADNTKFGKILTDSAGNTLYFFTIDANGSSGCTGDCLTAWPVFYTNSTLLGAGLDASDFATITRSDNKPQTTYKGWPLYYFQSDTKAGDVNGDLVGKVWFVAKPDYTIMLASTQLVGNNGISYDSLYQPNLGITHYITDDRGRTLYAFGNDHFKHNTYTHADFGNNAMWPCDTLVTIHNVPSLLDKSKFDTTNVFGKSQIVYNGWPLYYFGPDSLIRGKNKGVSLGHPGLWAVQNAYTTVAPQ